MTADAAATLASIAIGGMVYAGWWVFGELLPERRHRRALTRDANRLAREKLKLPEHERCSCGACATWRQREFGA